MLKFSSHRAGRAAILLAALAAPAMPAHAQYGGAPPFAVVRETPEDVLARNVRLLAQNPRNFTALVAAGRAALATGDTQAAVGFFGRAEDVSPQSWQPQAGMAAAMVAMGDAHGSFNYFARAQQLGAAHILIAVDRGLAFDLIGDQAKAQSDYRAALSGADADEARRRLALSLAISRDIRGAGDTIEPLLRRRDPESLRVNAFVLALAGDRDGARRTIDAAMPGAGARFEPFFKVLPVLRPAEKAAAVHLGEFPKDAAQRYAQAEPISSSPVLSIGNSAPPRTVAVPTRTPPRATPSKPVKIAEAPRRAVRQAAQPSTYMSMVRPSLDPSRYASIRRPKTETAAQKSEPAASDPEPRPAGRLDDTAELLSAPSVEHQVSNAEPMVELASAEMPPPTPLIIETQPAGSALEINTVPPPSEPKYEAPPVSRPKVETSRPKTSAKTKADEKKPAKPAEPASRHFVQLASGANADRLPAEYRKIRARRPSLFSGHAVQVSKGKDLFRLVVGPFKTRDDSREFVNDLAKAGIDGFTYTAPDGLKFEKIPAR